MISIRNHEYYMDTTPYHALRNIEKGMNMMNKTGEIWTVDVNGVERFAVIIKDYENNNFSSGLLLSDIRNEYKTYDVTTTHGVYCTQVSMLTYFYDNRLIRFDRKLKDDEYAALMGEIASLFGFSAESDKLPAEVEKIDQTDDQSLAEDLREDVSALETALCAQEEVNRCMEKKIIRVEAERDVYKDLYMQAVSK